MYVASAVSGMGAKDMEIQTLLKRLLLLNTIFVFLSIVVYFLTGVNPFSEGGVITFLSAFQLLAISRITYKTAQARKTEKDQSSWSGAPLIWTLVSTGFAFLAIDEVLYIHEQIDKLIHYILDIKETGLTDRIDDIIVGIYALVGIAVLFAFKNEVKTCIDRFSFFILGFALLFTMVGLDILTNRDDILLMHFDETTTDILMYWLSSAEDSMKIFAEAFFILGFYSALLKARSLKALPAA